MKQQTFNNGMTVKDLKDSIKDWPELDDNGDPLEVWVGMNDVSNECFRISPLNLRNGKADILLET